jgi:biopolymer transport protein TolR
LLNLNGNFGRKRKKYTQMSEINVTPFVDVMLVLLIVFMVTAPLLTFVIPVDLPKVKASALTDQKDPLEITVKVGGEVYLGESKVEVENLIPRLNAITELNREARIYIRGDRVVAYGRIMEIMSLVNSAGYIKVALVTETPSNN